MANETLTETKKRILQVIMFENWLRFYFITEDGEHLVIRLSEQAKAKIAEKYGNFSNLVSILEEKPIDHQVSLNGVCMFVAQHIDGVTTKMATTSQVFESPDFQLETHLFNTWVQSHEDTLDSTFLEFTTWENMYNEWKATESVQEYIAKVQDTISKTSTLQCPTQ